MEHLEGKVVLVTGASSGIGAGTAVDFARHGCLVVLTGRNTANLQLTHEQCIQAGAQPDNLLCVQGDLTVQDDVNTLVQTVLDKFSTIHVLVNNAGGVVMGSFESSTVDDFDAMYHTNLRSVHMVTKAALPSIIENKGAIVNVSSIAGSRPVFYCFAYSVMKAALNQFTQCLAAELAPKGVRVNSVNPGVVDTPIFVRHGGHIAEQPEKKEDFYAACASAHPMGRIGNVSEVSDAILFLASPSSSFTTGMILPVDGGRHLTVSRPTIDMAGETSK